MRPVYIITILIIIISFIIAFYYYPKLPDTLASHWNAQGEVDGYMSKFWALFLMPIMSVGLFLMFIIIPKIDPLKKNIEKFRKYFDVFMVLIVLFMFYVFILTVVWNAGKSFNMGQAMTPAMGLLFYYVGVLIGHAKRNWFVGIRTPWTLSSEKVWEKTHKLGSKLFKIAGIIAFLGIFFPSFAIWIVLVPVLFVAFYTLAYSYIIYQKEGK